LLISFNFALIAVLGGFVYQKHLELERLYAEREYAEAWAISRLSDSVAEMELFLGKGPYATSPEVFAALGTGIYNRAAVAALILEKLPLELEETAAFFAAAGDFASALARTAYGRTEHTAEELAKLRTFSETVTLVGAAISRPDLAAFAGLAQVEAELAGSVSVFAPVAERAEAGVTVEEARAAVAAFMDLKEGIFVHAGLREESLSTHAFLARVDGGDFIVEACRARGQVVRAKNTRQVRSAPLSIDEGLRLAETFMARNGYTEMEPRHWQVVAGELVVRFVHVQDGVWLYPDWVEVSVGLDNGRMTGFSAVEYVLSHRVRELPEPAVLKEQAMGAVPDALKVEDYHLAVIAGPGGRELLCYVFRCRGVNGCFLVYVNAMSGRQQEIRRLVEDETGFFVR